MRIVWLFLLVGVLVMIPFLIWGDGFERLFASTESAVGWLKGSGGWAWAAGLGLLIADLFLPVPSTVLMSALGFIYGPWVGGLVSAGGSFLAGTLAYELCGKLGEPAARKIAGAEGLEKGRQLFQRSGGWLVALSRWSPVLPEVIACMAGLTRMPPRQFYGALACGCIPMGFSFAAIGAVGSVHPAVAVGLNVAVPLILWWATSVLLGRHRSAAVRPGKSEDKDNPA